jgi:hypothetical protein
MWGRLSACAGPPAPLFKSETKDPALLGKSPVSINHVGVLRRFAGVICCSIKKLCRFRTFGVILLFEADLAKPSKKLRKAPMSFHLVGGYTE